MDKSYEDSTNEDSDSGGAVEVEAPVKRVRRMPPHNPPF